MIVSFGKKLDLTIVLHKTHQLQVMLDLESIFLSELLVGFRVVKLQYSNVGADFPVLQSLQLAQAIGKLSGSLRFDHMTNALMKKPASAGN